MLLNSQADNTVRTAIFLADAVLAPLLFIGGAILYVDQEARLRSRRDERRQRSEMPTYLMLTTLTEKGVQTLHANPARLAEVNRDVEEMGAKVLHQWAALGAYDFVNIVEAPDDLTIAKVSLALGARGSAKLESLPLISIDDFLASLD